MIHGADCVIQKNLGLAEWRTRKTGEVKAFSKFETISDFKMDWHSVVIGVVVGLKVANKMYHTWNILVDCT